MQSFIRQSQKVLVTAAGREKIVKRALLFPGQGSQMMGMGKQLSDKFKEARLVFEELDEALNLKLSSIIFQGPQELLNMTENAQPAILATSIAILRVLENESGFDVEKEADLALGHSLGEYTALVATKSLSLSVALKLVRLRGKAMSDAVEELPQPTAMTALVVRHGKLNDVLKVLTDETAKKKFLPDLSSEDVVEVANINSVVLSGTETAVNYATHRLQNALLAARALNLPVSAPFHCSLMKPVAETMGPALMSTQFVQPCISVISNVTGQPVKSFEDLPLLLTKQITQPVQWLKSLETCKKLAGVDEWLAFGPGRVVANLVQRQYSWDKVRRLEKAEEITTF